MVIDAEELVREHLCDIQGCLFELASKRGLDSRKFIEIFMNSTMAKQFDLPWSHTHCCGESYLLAELTDEAGGIPEGEAWDEDIMYWIGSTYRYWHLIKGVSSQDIYAMMDAERMACAYPAYHTASIRMAVDRLAENHQLEKKSDHMPPAM